MKEMGIIKPSHILWSCPIVIVPKKDGISTSSLMHRVDDPLKRLGCARYLTTMDLC